MTKSAALRPRRQSHLKDDNDESHKEKSHKRVCNKTKP